jgi:hypothetical protein
MSEITTIRVAKELNRKLMMYKYDKGFRSIEEVIESFITEKVDAVEKINEDTTGLED